MEDYNVLHVYGADTSSENSDGDDEEATVPIAKGLIFDQDLLDSARWNPVRRIGERFSARTGGQPGDKGSLYRTPEALEFLGNQPPVSEGQITQSTQSTVSEDQPSQAQALPVSEPTGEQKLLIVTPGQTVTFSQTPGQRLDLEWDSYLLGNSPFTPGLTKHHAGLARQLDRGQDDIAPFTSNFAKKLVVERRLSPVPMTVPQTGTIHKQAKNMDTGANQAQA